MDEAITVTNGDKIKFATDPDGYPAVRIENAAFVEAPRWISFGVIGKHDTIRAVDDMIHALTTVRARLDSDRG